MSQPSAATRIFTLERDLARHELEIHDHDVRVNKLERRVDVLAVRIGLYASIGAFAGGGVFAAAAAYLGH